MKAADVMTELKAQRWPLSVSSMSWSATGSCAFRARCWMSGSAGRSARPRKISPGSRPSKIILSGVDPVSGIAIYAFEEEAEREPPAA